VVLDRLKDFCSRLLGFPLLALVLKLIEWTGPNWWIWAAAVVIAFQLLLLLIAPAVIMPLFNKFTPLPEVPPCANALCAGEARRFSNPQHRSDGRQQTVAPFQRLLHRVGRFRKIVLFDTLVVQLAEPELESVLAHEIGHYKKRHVVKLLGVSIFGVFMGFAQSPGWRGNSGFIAHSVSSITRFCRTEHCAGDAAVCVVAGRSVFGFAAPSHLVAPVRVRGGCLRRATTATRNRSFKHCAN